MHGSVEQIRHTLGCEPTEVGQGPTVVALLHEVKGSIDELRGSIGEALSINRPMAGLSGFSFLKVPRVLLIPASIRTGG